MKIKNRFLLSVVISGLFFISCSKDETSKTALSERSQEQMTSVKAKQVDRVVLDQYMGELMKQIIETAESDSVKTLAVIPFEDISRAAKSSNIGRTMTEYLHGRLSENKNLIIVERSMIDRVLQELNLNMTGLIEAENAKQAGKMISADAIICGTVTEIGMYFDINLRVIDVEEGKILSSAIAEIKKDVFIEEYSVTGTEAETIQAGLNALQIAVDMYGNLNVKDFTISFPSELQQLVPEYIDRIPDPVKGSWIYDQNTGTLSHSEFPDLKPVNPRINNQTILNKLEKNKIVSDLGSIRLSFANEWVETGDYPKDMKQVIKNGLPNSKDSEWIWDPKDSSVRFHKYPLPKMYLRKDGSTELVE